MPPDFSTFLAQALVYIQGLLAVFVTLAGVAALVSVLVDLAKRAGLPDGSAPTVAFVLNAVAFIALAAAGLFAHITPAQFDQFAAALATILTALLGFVGQVWFSPKVHDGLKAGHVPFLVVSNTLRKAAATK